MFFLVLNVRGRFPPLVRIWSRPYSHGEKFLAAWIFTIGSKNTIHGCHFFTPRRPVIWGNVIGGVMYSSHQQISSPEVVELRKEAGLWLKELRERRGLSQRQMAEKVGGNYYTFISQLESGRGRIPPDRYLVWAEVLGVEPKVFVRNLLRCYDPVTHSILFGKSDKR